MMPLVLNKYRDEIPPDAVFIGRPSKWGNPYVIGPDGDRDTVIAKFRRWFVSNPDRVASAQRELRGKTLVCFCSPARCHGHVLLEIANQGSQMTTEINFKPSFLNLKASTTGFTKSGIPYNKSIPVLNRKMQVIIPTHKRPTRQTTLRYLPDEIRAETLLVTSNEDDAAAIREHYSNLIEPEQVISIEAVDPKNHSKVTSIGKKRQWLLENIGSHAIFQMDDDFQGFYKRCSPKYRELDRSQGSPCWVLNEKGKAKDIKLLGRGNITDEDIVFLFRQLEAMLSGKGKPDWVAHGGISSRMGNNREDLEWVYGGRMMHAIGHHRGTLIENNIRFDEIQLREDFNVTLRLLRKGFKNAICYDICVSPDDYGREGGCSDERTVKFNDEQAELLAKMHPGLVKVVQKEYDHSIPRKEVQVSWQKALKEGQELLQLKTRSKLFGK